MISGVDAQSPFTVRYVLRPHYRSLFFGVLVIVGGSIADLMQPWPIKVIVDTVLKGREAHGRLAETLVWLTGNDELAMLKLAAIASLLIAALGALCSFAEKSLTTTVSQKVLHELR